MQKKKQLLSFRLTTLDTVIQQRLRHKVAKQSEQIPVEPRCNETPHFTFKKTPRFLASLFDFGFVFRQLARSLVVGLDVEVKVGVVGGQVDPPHAAEEVADGRLARIPFEQARGVAGSGDADFLGADLEHVGQVGALVERGGFGGLFFQELKKVEGEPVRWKLN